MMVPYDRSPLWRAHDAYFDQRGIGAWLDNEVPYRATNNYAMARSCAELLLELVQSGAREGGGIQLLEIGAGLGDFAARLLFALERDFGESGRRLLERLSYVYSDVSRTTISQATGRQPLAKWVASGHVVPALFDARAPLALTALDGRPLALEPTLVVANYVCCILPTKILRRRADRWFELHVDDSGVNHGDPQRGVADKWRELLGEYEWRSVALQQIFEEPVHAQAIARAVERARDVDLAYPHAFLELVERILGALRPGGLMLSSDFPDTIDDGGIGPGERVPLMYGNSLNHAVCVPLLQAFAAVRGDEVLDSGGTNGTTRTLAFARGRRAPEAVRRVFQANFGRANAGQDRLDFENAGRTLLATGDPRRAARFFERSLALDPYDHELYAMAGEASVADGNLEAALRYFEKGAELEPSSAYDFELKIAQACFAAGDRRRALGHLEASLAREPAPEKYVMLGDALRAVGSYADAYEAYRQALALAPDLERAEQALAALKDEWSRAELGLSEIVERWWATKIPAPR